MSSQTQTESIYGLFYTGDGTRDGSLGGAPTTVQVQSGELNNFFAAVSDDLAITGGKRYVVLALKNISVDKKSNKTSIIQELISTSADLKFKVAVSSSGINQAPVTIIDSTQEPVTENFIEVVGVPTIPNIGLLNPGDYIGIFIEMEVKTGASEAKAATSLFSVIGQSDPYVVPPPDPCPAGQHRDINGNCVPNECPPGQKWDPTANNGLGACVDDTTPVECPPGQHYDETLQQCVPDSNPPPTVPDITIAAVGDFDCNSRTDDTIDNIKQHANTDKTKGAVSHLLGLGDWSYGSSQSCCIDRMKNLGDMYDTNIWAIVGNHDDVEDGSASKRRDLLAAFVPARNSPGYYAGTIGPIRVIVMDTQSNYDSGSSQYNFVVDQLKKAAADGAIKFIIVCYHKPSIVSASDHGPLNDLRDAYHPLFDQYGVDLVLTGHNHLYHRSLPIKYNSSSPSNPIVMSDPQGNATSGTIYVTAGAGGRTADSFDGDPEPYIGARSEEYGVLFIYLIENGTKLECHYFTNSGERSDYFWIKVTGRGTA